METAIGERGSLDAAAGAAHGLRQGVAAAAERLVRVPPKLWLVYISSLAATGVGLVRRLTRRIEDPLLLDLSRLERRLQETPRRLLLVVWTTWCPGCISALQFLSRELAAGPPPGLDLLLLNVDHLSGATVARARQRALHAARDTACARFLAVYSGPKRSFHQRLELPNRVPHFRLHAPGGRIVWEKSGQNLLREDWARIVGG